MSGGIGAGGQAKKAWDALAILQNRLNNNGELLPALLQHIETKQYIQFHRAFAICADAGIAALLPYLTSTNYNPKINALNALSEMDCPQAVDDILALVHDDDDEIRFAALKALACTRHPKALATLQNYDKVAYPVSGLKTAFISLINKCDVPQQIEKYQKEIEIDNDRHLGSGYYKVQREMNEKKISRTSSYL